MSEGESSEKTSSWQSSSESPTPKELFKRMADNDFQQNRRLSASNSVSAAASTANLMRPSRNKRTKIRFLVCALGVISLAMAQMSRMVLNSSITQMVSEDMKSEKSEDNNQLSADGSCPWPEEIIDPVVSGLADTTSTTSPDLPLDEVTPSYEASSTIHDDMQSDLIQSTPATTVATTIYSLMDADIASSTTPAPVTPTKNHDQFDWPISKQQVLLGGFYYSYFVFMVLGGRMAEIYGAKYVLLLGIAGSAVINLLTPWMARNSFVMLVGSRVVMGAIQSGVFPGVYALLNKWLTLSEASIFAPLIKMNLRLGMTLGAFVPGIMDGWPSIFYFTGFISTVWSVLWLVLATSDPAENTWVSQEELAHINRKKQDTSQIVYRKPTNGSETDKSLDVKRASKSNEEPTPWIPIITSPSVIGLIVVKLCFNYALDFLAILLPSYLKYVHHADKSRISAITTPMFTIQVVLIVFVGWFAKVAIEKKPFGFDKTMIRKIFQGLASYGAALGLFLLTFNDCNLIFVTIILQLISFLTMFTAGGETMLPYDLSSKYPATIMAIANSIANLSAVTTTVLAGLILGNQGASYARWNLLMYLIAGANVVGGMAFSLLVEAKPVDFTKTAKKSPRNGTSKNQQERVDVELGK